MSDTAFGSSLEERKRVVSEQFLLKRRCSKRLRNHSPVLLIDEVDARRRGVRTFLLEMLTKSQIIPSPSWERFSPARATRDPDEQPDLFASSPMRCGAAAYFLWLPYPSLDQEINILRARVPGLAERLAQPYRER